MRFSFTPEQEEFRTGLRRALESRSPTKEVRRLMATEAGFERESWQRLNQELGLTAILVPESYGGKGFVLDGHTADLVVVLARQQGTHGEDGLSFFTVTGDSSGLERRRLKTMDETRKLARLKFNSVEARLLGEAGGGAAPFARTMHQAAVLLANEMVGGAERLREDALAYTKMRMQFGRSIASFQTTKNKAADMLVDVELAKSAAYYAAAALDEGDNDMPALASLAKAQASEAYLQTAIHAVQMHGGIGFTWDNDTHLWFKRAKSSEILFGDANEHREKMMQHWGE